MARTSQHRSSASEQDFHPDKQRTEQLKGAIVLIKYGGNAMVREDCKQSVVDDICKLREIGAKPVVVHGGGPAIAELLDKVSLKSDFIGGHRKTTHEMMEYVEMALSGKVNGEIVKLLCARNCRAVGLSGKDGGMVKASRRLHKVNVGGKLLNTDLGHVGDVESVNTDLLQTLLNDHYMPVIAPIGVGDDLENYNINADMFAGHLAGALKAAHYVILTDVDGLRRDRDNPQTLITALTAEEARGQIGKAIDGGMIPKVESCLIALGNGARTAHIVSGITRHSILIALLTDERIGTQIRRS